MNKWYKNIIVPGEENKKLIKRNKGLVLKVRGRIKGISRTRKLSYRKGGIGSIDKNYKESKIGINTKWGRIGLTILRSTNQ